jgi:hypothetical protein
LLPFSFHEFLAAKDPRLAKIYEEKNKTVKEFLLSSKINIKKDTFLKEFAPFFDQYITSSFLFTI